MTRPKVSLGFSHGQWSYLASSYLLVRRELGCLAADDQLDNFDGAAAEELQVAISNRAPHVGHLQIGDRCVLGCRNVLRMPRDAAINFNDCTREAAADLDASL